LDNPLVILVLVILYAIYCNRYLRNNSLPELHKN
jgi:hypothetical protein